MLCMYMHVCRVYKILCTLISVRLTIEHMKITLSHFNNVELLFFLLPQLYTTHRVNDNANVCNFHIVSFGAYEQLQATFHILLHTFFEFVFFCIFIFIALSDSNVNWNWNLVKEKKKKQKENNKNWICKSSHQIFVFNYDAYIHNNKRTEV